MTTPSSLLLSLQYAEHLDPNVRAELEQIMQALQTWAGKIQAADGNFVSSGAGTFLGQPRCKLNKRTTQSIPDSTYTFVTWPPALSGSPLEEYDDDAMFDGSSYIACSTPGLYVVQAEVEWAANAVGTRIVSIHPNIPFYGTDFTSISSGGNAGAVGSRQVVTSVFPVIQNHPLGQIYVPFPLLVGVRVYQNSGGPLNIGVNIDRFGVWKVS